MPISTGRIEVRLSTHELAQLAELRAKLATPILPNVSVSDVVRAGLRVLAAKLAADEAAHAREAA